MLLLLTLACARYTPEEKTPVDSGTHQTDTQSNDSGATGDSGDSELPPVDADEDGYPNTVDCDDEDPMVHPDADELCDQRDQDCDTLVDESALDRDLWFRDDDGDGYGQDTDPLLSCEAPVGYTSVGQDCDDTNVAISPAAVEICDGLDNDCDGLTDDDDSVTGQSTFYLDNDTDGYGDATATVLACDLPEGYTADGTDCNDADADISPTATEVCDSFDNDCDGLTDDDDSVTGQSTFYLDNDTDGYGDATSAVLACDLPEGYTTDNTDCNDDDINLSPAATEVCDGLDNDCDGLTDDDDIVEGQSFFYADSDADGYGDATRSLTACVQPEGYTSDSADCDDTDAAISPAATEICDSLDNDCDGFTDDDDIVEGQSTFYLDNDADGYGDATLSTVACTQPEGYVSASGDCTDTNGAISPAGTEVCDDADIDEDCDGLSDNADDSTDTSGMSSLYLDLDGDGYGVTEVMGCDASNGYASTGDDCDDGDANSSPAATEVCDGVDNNCDAETDEKDATGCTTYYYDNDSDGVGRWSNACLCAPSAPYQATITGDCADNDPTATSVGDAPVLSSSEWAEAGVTPAASISLITAPPSGYPLYVGSTLSGSWRADDDTLTWEPLITFTTHTYSEFAVNPDDPWEVYRNDGGRLARSLDGGENWTILIGDITDNSQMVSLFSIDLPEIYVIMEDGVINYSADGGETFEYRTSLFSDGTIFGRGAPRRLLLPEAEGQAAFLATDSVIARSTDDMYTWQILREDIPNPYSLARIPMGLVVGTEDGLAVSNDEGETWTDYDIGRVSATLYSENGGWTAFVADNQLYIDGVYKDLPQTAKAMALAGERILLVWNNGVMYSDDYGDTWNDTAAMKDGGMAVMGSHPVCDNEIYVATRCSGGAYISEDYGQSWLSFNASTHYVMGVHTDPFNPDLLWVVSDNFLMRYDINEQSGEDIVVRYHFHGFAVHPTEPDVLLLGSVESGEYSDSKANIYRSTDGGATWAESSIGIPEAEESSAHTILYWPDNPDVVLTGFYKGGGVSHDTGEGIGLYRSVDGGLSWSLTSLPLEDVAYLTTGPDGVWAATEDGLWYSIDEGESWTRADPDGYFLSVAFHDDIGLAYTQEGVAWRSDDGGATWYVWSTSLPENNMTWLAQIGFSADGTYAYVTSYNYGVYYIAL